MVVPPKIKVHLQQRVRRKVHAFREPRSSSTFKREQQSSAAWKPLVDKPSSIMVSRQVPEDYVKAFDSAD